MTLIFEPSTPGAKAFLAKPVKRHWIGGEFVPASSGKTFAAYDPASGQIGRAHV